MTEIIDEESGSDLRCRCCGRLLAYKGVGRKPQFCPDELHNGPNGQTCRAAHAAQRAAETAAGMAVPLDAYRDAVGLLVPALDPVVALLMAVRDAAGEVEAGALRRIGEAEAAAVAAAERAQSAEDERDRAVRDAAVARREADVAKEAGRVAERRARDAERTAAEVRQRAWQDVAEAQQRQGMAEGYASERAQAVITETGRREMAEARADEAGRQLAETRRELSGAQAEIRRVEKDRATVAGRAAELEVAVATERARADAAYSDYSTARESLETALEDLDAAGAVVARLREALEVERAAGVAAREAGARQVAELQVALAAEKAVQARSAVAGVRRRRSRRRTGAAER